MKRKRQYKKMRPRNLFALHLFVEGEDGLFTTKILNMYQHHILAEFEKTHIVDENQTKGYLRLLLKDSSIGGVK